MQVVITGPHITEPLPFTVDHLSDPFPDPHDPEDVPLSDHHELPPQRSLLLSGAVRLVVQLTPDNELTIDTLSDTDEIVVLHSQGGSEQECLLSVIRST